MGRPCKGEERRNEILAAFEACVFRKGFERTTLDDVAAAANQPRSLVRHHIGNREDMVSALVDRLLDRSSARIDRIQPSGGVDQVITLLMESVFDNETTNVVIMELWHVGLRDQIVRKRLAKIYHGLVEKVAGMIARIDPEPAAMERAYSAVCLAFGAAFFRYLGLRPPDSSALYRTERSILVGDLPSIREAPNS